MLRQKIFSCGRYLFQTQLLKQSTSIPCRSFTSSRISSNDDDGKNKDATDANADNKETEAFDAKEEENQESSLEKENKELKAKNEELNNQLLRSLAECENVRRIARMDVQNSKDFAISKFAKSLLDVSDNLQRAHESVAIDDLNIETSLNAIKSLHEGVVMTDSLMQKVFNSFGIVKVGNVGDMFDPNMHEALFEYVDPNKDVGTIGEVLKSGYILHKRVIRPAQVATIKAATEKLHD